VTALRGIPSLPSPMGRRRRARVLGEFLVACVREREPGEARAEVAQLIPAVDQRWVADMAVRHRVVPAVLLTLQGAEGAEPEVLSRLRSASQSALARQMLIDMELRQLHSALRDFDWLVVKGPALALGYYRRPELRSYGDLDVLVPPADFGRAVQALEEAGYEVFDRNWTLLNERMAGELHLVSPRGVVIDLHWDLSNDRATRESYGMATRSFIDRAERLSLGDVDVRTLDALDTAVHTAVHAARSGGDRLVWMKDLEQLVLAGRFSWPELAVRSAEHCAQLPVATMLDRMRTTLGVPGVPSGALRQVGGSATWRAVGRLVDRYAPISHADAEGSAARMYARATRGDGTATAMELGRRLVARARRGHSPQLNPTWDGSDVQSLRYEAGGSSGRAAYLTAVARQG
jgi:hypothetical protein